MHIALHANARTTPKIREELRRAPASVSNAALAREYGLHPATVKKWRGRECVEDASHRPQKLSTTLSEAQEAIVVALREMLLLPLDDLLVLTREFIHPQASRSALDRCLRRHGLSNLKALVREQEGAQEGSERSYKPFKAYEPGYVHVDVKYLPQMADERARKYLFVAIDRATRWVYLEVRASKSAKAAEGFLKGLLAKAPFRVRTVLTDNGKEFTDRFCATGERQPTGAHPFDALCTDQAIDHRLTRPRRPQTNGMVERFNGRISEILTSTRFDSAQDLRQTLMNYMRVYNHHIPQKALGHISPVAALKQWQQIKPELFLKRVHNQPGLDS